MTDHILINHNHNHNQGWILKNLTIMRDWKEKEKNVTNGWKMRKCFQKELKKAKNYEVKSH